VGSLRPDDFVAEVDLRGVPRGVSVPASVRVRSAIGGVIVQTVEPSTINVTVEDVITREDVRVDIEVGAPPPQVQLGELQVSQDTVSIRGARSRVDAVDRVMAAISVEPAALDIDTVVELLPVDASGTQVPGISVVPRTVEVHLDVIADNASKNAVPIAAVWDGTPAPGYHVTQVTIDPATVTVVGDADELATLVAIDTVPITIAGATQSLTRMVELAVPTGFSVATVDRVTVRVTIDVEDATRTFGAGFELVGADPTLAYQIGATQVTLTLFGPVLELDRIAQSPLLVDLDVTGLGPGIHQVEATPRIPAVLSATATTPSSVTVTIASATPSVSASPASGSAP
jgi:YbbR domain-containing protein